MTLLLETQVVYAKKDKTAPTGSIVINNGDEFTTSVSVVLILTAKDPESGIKEVRLSNTDVWDNPWEEFSSTKSWTLLPGEGVKTVYYQIKNNNNSISIIYTDTIILYSQDNNDEPTPTPEPSSDPTSTPIPSPTPTDSPIPTPSLTPEPTVPPAPSPTPNPTSSPSPIVTPTPTPNQTTQPSVSPNPPIQQQELQPTPDPITSITPNPSPESNPVIGNRQVSLDFEQRRTIYYGVAAISLIIGFILFVYILLSK